MIEEFVCTLVKKGLGWMLCRLPPGVAVWFGEGLGDMVLALPSPRHPGMEDATSPHSGTRRRARRVCNAAGGAPVRGCVGST